MSENKSLGTKNSTDLTLVHSEDLQKFIEAGLPGISKVTESSMFQWFNLYISGKNYNEIAEICNSELVHILYIANKFNWFEKKMSHYNNIMTKLDSRVQATRLESAEFIMDVITFIHKKHGAKITEFLRTNNQELLKGISLSELDKYFKSIDALSKVLVEPPKMPAIPNAPGVHIHLGDSKIERKEDGSIEISSLKDIVKSKKR